jgi:hypothetical protein
MNAAAHIPDAVRIGSPLLGDFDLVAMDMREDERLQWLATVGRTHYSPTLCARTLVALEGPQFVLVGADSRPLVLGGFEPVRPGVDRGWMAATSSSWDRCWFALTREARRLMRHRFAEGVHRIEAVALASRTRTAEWFERGLGMTREGVLRGYVADGQDAVIYSRTRED